MADSIRETILESCFSRFNTTFASGKSANNKLDLELIASNPVLREQIGRRMAHLARVYDPDFVVGVPRGANWLASDIANYLGVEKVVLDKDPKTSSVDFAGSEDELRCARVLRGVVVEDVFNEYTNTRRVLAIPQIGERAVAAIAIWDRGLVGEREPLSIDTKSLINFHIPVQLPSNSELWKYAD